MTEEEARAIFILAGFKVRRVRELPNGYWPDDPGYAEVRKPWWLVTTEYGPVEIGWRKRVISIDWDEMSVRGIVTEDDVTKDETAVHAYSYAKAVEYVTELRRIAQRAKKADE